MTDKSTIMQGKTPMYAMAIRALDGLNAEEQELLLKELGITGLHDKIKDAQESAISLVNERNILNGAVLTHQKALLELSRKHNDLEKKYNGAMLENDVLKTENDRLKDELAAYKKVLKNQISVDSDVVNLAGIMTENISIVDGFLNPGKSRTKNIVEEDDISESDICKGLLKNQILSVAKIENICGLIKENREVVRKLVHVEPQETGSRKKFFF